MVVPMVTVSSLFIAVTPGTRAITGASLVMVMVMVTMVRALRKLITIAFSSLAIALLLVNFPLSWVDRLLKLPIAPTWWAAVACLVSPTT